MANQRGGATPPPPLSQMPPHQIDWYEQAACIDTADSLEHIFFPPDDNYEPVINQAAQICQTCPAYDKCHTWAVDNPRWTQHGVWAATTPRDRETIRERRRKAWRQHNAGQQHNAGRGKPTPDVP